MEISNVEPHILKYERDEPISSVSLTSLFLFTHVLFFFPPHFLSTIDTEKVPLRDDSFLAYLFSPFDVASLLCFMACLDTWYH